MLHLQLLRPPQVEHQQVDLQGFGSPRFQTLLLLHLALLLREEVLPLDDPPLLGLPPRGRQGDSEGLQLRGLLAGIQQGDLQGFGAPRFQALLMLLLLLLHEEVPPLDDPRSKARLLSHPPRQARVSPGSPRGQAQPALGGL